MEICSFSGSKIKENKTDIRAEARDPLLPGQCACLMRRPCRLKCLQQKAYLGEVANPCSTIAHFHQRQTGLHDVTMIKLTSLLLEETGSMTMVHPTMGDFPGKWFRKASGH